MPDRKTIRLATVGKILCLFVCLAAWIVMSSSVTLGTPGFREYSSDLNPLDIRPGYGVDEVRILLTKLGEAGRSFYQRFLLVDLVFIFTFAYTQVLLTRRVAGKTLTSGMMRLGIILCLGRGLFDLVEDGLVFLLIRLFPDVPGGVVRIASLATQVKFGLLIPWLVLLLYVFFHRLRRHRTED